MRINIEEIILHILFARSSLFITFFFVASILKGISEFPHFLTMEFRQGIYQNFSLHRLLTKDSLTELKHETLTVNAAECSIVLNYLLAN